MPAAQAVTATNRNNGNLVLLNIATRKNQNVILVPSWISLGLLIWLLISPNWVLVNIVLGVPKYTVFVALSASARNCARIRSLMENVLNTDKSQLNSPGPRTLRNRLVLPNVNCAA